MTKLLDEAIAELGALPEEEQDRAAAALLAFIGGRREYTLSIEQIGGIRHAMAQADRGEFASAKRLRRIFGRRL